MKLPFYTGPLLARDVIEGELVESIETAATERRPRTVTRARDWTTILSSQWMLALILATACLVYLPTLRDWFSSDDFWFLRAAQTHSIGRYTLTSFDFRQTGTSAEFDRYRPLYPIAWRLQYAAFGMHAGYYHAVVVGLHLGCTVLAWFIARRLFAAAWMANLVTLIFAIHPVYADAVAWLSGGNRVFETFPYLLSLLLFMKYLDRRRGRAAWLLAASFVCYVVAVLFHSSALSLAAVLPAYAFLIAGESFNLRRPLAWSWFAPFLVVTLIEAGIQYWVRGHLGIDDGFRFGFHQYSNYAQYLGLAVVPIERHTISGFGGSIAATLQQVGALAALALAFGLVSRRPRYALGIFAVAWLFASLLPDSTLILGTFGRAMYMPGLAIAVFLVAAVLWLRDAMPERLSHAAVRWSPYALLIALVPTLWLTHIHVRTTSRDSSRDQQFAEAVRRDAPVPPAGGILYVVNAPKGLTFFGDSRLEQLTQLYLPVGTVRSLEPADAAEAHAALTAADRIYRYAP